MDRAIEVNLLDISEALGSWSLGGPVDRLRALFGLLSQDARGNHIGCRRCCCIIYREYCYRWLRSGAADLRLSTEMLWMCVCVKVNKFALWAAFLFGRLCVLRLSFDDRVMVSCRAEGWHLVVLMCPLVASFVY